MRLITLAIFFVSVLAVSSKIFKDTRKNKMEEIQITKNDPLKANRPPLSQRKFNSTVINQVIDEVKAKLSDPILGIMFEQNFPNTLDTTVQYFGVNQTTGRPDTFIITGDITAMWQRDSTNQVLPYLPYVNQDENLKKLILGVINRQIHNVNLDPYANAYNFNKTGSPWDSDSTTKLIKGRQVNAMIPELWERKFEIDSLGAVLKLQVEYYDNSGGDTSFMHEDYFKSLRAIYDVLIEQQLGTREEDEIHRVPYTFQRQTVNPTDSTQHGRGNICKGKGGMVKSAFRPSDDACFFPYFIPGNAMLVTYLKRTSEIIQSEDANLSQKYQTLSEEIKAGIYSQGITKDIDGNDVFAYETDGFGNYYKMDDANIPSLLSLPYLRFIDKNDPLYQNTRKMVLDPNQNPYFFQGKSGKGIGGPHAGDQYIWPMAIITRAITSDNDQEILECLNMLKDTTAGTYFMHESFFANNSNNFTRSWFAWANTYFGELILDLLNRKPELITNKI